MQAVGEAPTAGMHASENSMYRESRLPAFVIMPAKKVHRCHALILLAQLAHDHRVALRIFTRHDRSSALSAIEKTCGFSRMSAKKGRSTGETPSTLGQTSSSLLGLQAFASGSQDPHPACLPPRLASSHGQVKTFLKMVKTFLKMVKNIERLTLKCDSSSST